MSDVLFVPRMAATVANGCDAITSGRRVRWVPPRGGGFKGSLQRCWVMAALDDLGG